MTKYYIQSIEDEKIVICPHTYDDEEKEYYHEFIDRKKAIKHRNELKKKYPNSKFRLVKETTTYTTDKWV